MIKARKTPHPQTAKPSEFELTERQLEIYEYIAKCIKEGMPPTCREIGKQFNISSPNGVRGHLLAMKSKGYIETQRKSRDQVDGEDPMKLSLMQGTRVPRRKERA